MKKRDFKKISRILIKRGHYFEVLYNGTYPKTIVLDGVKLIFDKGNLIQTEAIK